MYPEDTSIQLVVPGKETGTYTSLYLSLYVLPNANLKSRIQYQGALLMIQLRRPRVVGDFIIAADSKVVERWLQLAF